MVITLVIKVFVSLCVFLGGWKLAKIVDTDYMERVKKYSAGAAVVYIILAAALVQREFWAREILDSLFWSSIVSAAFCDYNTKEVYDFCYLSALISGCISLALERPWQGIMELLLFGVIQWVLFRKLYGEADCLAFFVCAVYMTAYGGRLIDYVLFMAGVFVLLTVIQMARRNVAGNGNLKEGVPLIPYIAAVMLAVMIWRR